MELRRNLLLLLLLLTGFCGFVAGQESLTIGDGTSVGLSQAVLPITMDASSSVQGFVLAIGYDESKVTADDLAAAGGAEDAELIIPEVLTGGVTMGVIMDADPPYAGQTIAPGSGILIADLTLTPVILVSAETVVPVSFAEGVLNTPILNNVIVQGGLSIGVGEGLVLNDGSLTIQEPPPATMKIEDSSAPADGLGTIGDARIRRGLYWRVLPPGLIPILQELSSRLPIFIWMVEP